MRADEKATPEEIRERIAEVLHVSTYGYLGTQRTRAETYEMADAILADPALLDLLLKERLDQVGLCHQQTCKSRRPLPVEDQWRLSDWYREPVTVGDEGCDCPGEPVYRIKERDKP